MSCELYKSEMYMWRPGSDVTSFRPLFEHLATCPECAQRFANLSASDQTIRQTFQELPDSHALEARILAGLAHQRAQDTTNKQRWRSWMILPVAASLLFGIMFGIKPWIQETRLSRQVASILNSPPAAEIDSTDQKMLLDWSAAVLSGPAALPPELSRVQFRAATALNVANHKAVLLSMKNERRASLLIVDALMTPEKTIKSFHDQEGSDSRWSDGTRTYVLLFRGTEQEMRAYMSRMGITA
jgi:anti-sigma factor RsiW